MDKVAALSTAERRELFSETAARRGMTPAIVEKDFWDRFSLYLSLQDNVDERVQSALEKMMEDAFVHR